MHHVGLLPVGGHVVVVNPLLKGFKVILVTVQVASVAQAFIQQIRGAVLIHHLCGKWRGSHEVQHV